VTRGGGDSRPGFAPASRGRFTSALVRWFVLDGPARAEEGVSVPRTVPSAFGVVAPEPLECPTEDGSDEPEEPPDGSDEPSEEPADPPPDVWAGLGSGSGSGVSPDWGEPA
jgi:hypothetical protein